MHKVKDTWIPNKTIGIQISLNSDSVLDYQEMMAPRAHHTHCRLASPSIKPPRGQGDPEDTKPLTSLYHPAPGQTGQEGARHDNTGQRRMAQMAVMTG